MLFGNKILKELAEDIVLLYNRMSWSSKESIENDAILFDVSSRVKELESKVDLLLEHLALEYKEGPRLEHKK